MTIRVVYPHVDIPCLAWPRHALFRIMDNSSINPKRPGGHLFWDPYGSNASLRPTQRRKPVSFGSASLAMKDHAYRAVSTPSMQSHAQSGTGLHLRRSSLHTTTSRVHSTRITSELSQRTEISSLSRSVTFPRATCSAYLDPRCNNGPSRAHQSQNRDAFKKGDKETQRAMEVCASGVVCQGDF